VSKMVSGSVIDWPGQISGQREVRHGLHLIVLIAWMPVPLILASLIWKLLGMKGKRKRKSEQHYRGVMERACACEEVPRVCS
jgi:hypothetical protein